MKIANRLYAFYLSVLLSLGAISNANAVVITFANRAAFDAAFPSSIVENWDGFSNGTIFLDGSTVNGITYTSSAGNAMVTDVFVVTTEPNGLGDSLVEFFQTGDSIAFGFSFPLTAFGIDINTSASTPGAYTATTNNGDIILSVFDPFPGISTGQFVGFSSSISFSSVTIATAIGGEPYTLDTLRAVPVRVAVVPEPSSVLLATLGLLGLGFARRHKFSS